MPGSRTDQWLYTVSIDGQDLGTFDGKTGGKLTAESTKWRAGGMGKELSYGGPSSREDLTLTRRYDLDRDHPLMGFLDSKVGKGDVAVKGQPLDVDGNPYGATRTYTGTLMGVESPEHDSNSNEIGILTLEVEANEVAS